MRQFVRPPRRVVNPVLLPVRFGAGEGREVSELVRVGPEAPPPAAARRGASRRRGAAYRRRGEVMPDVPQSLHGLAGAWTAT